MDKALTITCPHCGRTFALDEGILQPIRASILTSVEADFQTRTKKEVELARLQAEQQAKTLVEQQTAALKQQAEESAATAKAAREREKAALDAQLKLTREKEELDLVYRRQMLEELEKARVEVRSKLDLDLKQRDQTIDGLKKQIEDLQRKAELGSQQAQGEALESTIKKRLETAFPTDLIEDVPTGTRGADVIQKVNGKTGRCCGTIIWESKQTKAWAHDWIAKLKKNQAEAGAEVAVIASAVLPEGVEGFSQVESVWVTSWPLAIQLASALRFVLTELDRTKLAEEGKSHKMELLYDYLVSNQFQQRVQSIVEAFTQLEREVEREKRVMQVSWARRQKLIESVRDNTTSMRGHLEAIVGSELPPIPALDMHYALEAGDETEGEA